MKNSSKQVWFGGGAQNKSGKVAAYGDSFAMYQLRQKWAISLLSCFNYIKI